MALTKEQVIAARKRRKQAAKAQRGEPMQPPAQQQPTGAQQPRAAGFGETLLAGLEEAAAIGSGIIAEPLAGISGMGGQLIGALTGDPERGARNVEQMREALTYQPRTELAQARMQQIAEAAEPVTEAISGFEQRLGDQALAATGSPALAAAATTLPTLAAELVGIKGGRGLKAKTKKQMTTREKAMAEALETQADDILSDAVTEVKSLNPQKAAELVKADPRFYKAAEELGINTEPIAAFASQNPQFRDISGGLQAVPGSVIDAQAKKFINETATKADELIQQYGGSIDKAQLGQDFKRASLETVEQLENSANELYKSLGEQIPKGSRYEAVSTIDFIKDKIDEFGSVQELPGKLKAIYGKLAPKEKVIKSGKTVVDPATGRKSVYGRETETRLPTYETMDQIRKELGQAIRQRSGVFKDMETGLSKALYSRLTSDIEDIAGGAGNADLLQSAKGVVKQRKMLEDNLQTLLGKDLNTALNVTVSGAVKNLEKGQIDKFNKVVNAIPKAQRPDVVMSALNDVFRGRGVGKEALDPTSFTRWYEQVNRSPATKNALFKELPPESRKAIDNLYTVSKGISTALQSKIPTGRINAMFNDQSTFIRKIVGNAAVANAARRAGPTIGYAYDHVNEFLRQGSDYAKRASDMIGTPEFANLMRKAAADGFAEGARKTRRIEAAEKALMKTRAYQKWIENLTSQEAALAGTGILGYLMSEDRKPQQQEQQQ